METFSSRRAEENVQNWARGTCESGRGRLRADYVNVK